MIKNINSIYYVRLSKTDGIKLYFLNKVGNPNKTWQGIKVFENSVIIRRINYYIFNEKIKQKEFFENLQQSIEYNFMNGEISERNGEPAVMEWSKCGELLKVLYNNDLEQIFQAGSVSGSSKN